MKFEVENENLIPDEFLNEEQQSSIGLTKKREKHKKTRSNRF